MPLNRAL